MSSPPPDDPGPGVNLSPAQRRWALAAAGVAGIVLATFGIWLAVRSNELPAGPGPIAVSPEPTRPRYELHARVTSVETRPVGRPSRKRRLHDAVRAVRETVTGLYSTGFVDPAAWRDGRFPALPDFFVERARPQVRRDLRHLTLGGSARQLNAVRPERARLDIRFLVGAGRRPVAAIAEMNFAGRGFRGRDRRATRIRHLGRYVLRPKGDRWLVAAYQARRDMRPAGDVALRSDDTLFVLAIGSDARPGQSVARARADSLHIIGVNPRRGVASILGIPRDSYVPIPGHGSDKINAALYFGGPELQVRTVEALTGIRIDGYLLTAFEGFKRAVTAIGGVEVDVPYPISDPLSGARFSPGRTRMNAQEALAFSRNRHDAPGGDFGRSANQGRLIVAAFRELRHDVVRDPAALFRWIVAAYRNIQTNLGVDEMLELLLGALTIDPEVENRVVSGGGGFVGSKSVVRLGSSAHALFADLRRDGVLGR